MSYRTVIEGNAFYEIDEDCIRRRLEERLERERQGQIQPQPCAVRPPSSGEGKRTDEGEMH